MGGGPDTLDPPLEIVSMETDFHWIEWIALSTLWTSEAQRTCSLCVTKSAINRLLVAKLDRCRFHSWYTVPVKGNFACVFTVMYGACGNLVFEVGPLITSLLFWLERDIVEVFFDRRQCFISLSHWNSAFLCNRSLSCPFFSNICITVIQTQLLSYGNVLLWLYL